MSEHKTTMTPEMEAGLAKYFEARAQQREQRFNEQWDSLTAREQSLVREAAVMGYVRGSMFGEANARRESRGEFPLDSAILRDVLSGCEAHADIYPILAHLGEDWTEEFEAWLADHGVDDLSSITDDQRHNRLVNFFKDPER